VRPDTTFVFVTPRVWKLKPGTPLVEEWVGAKRGESDWKGVQVVDAIALEAWLEEHPPVGSRFARQFLRVVPRTGARDIAEFWDEYSARFQPAITKEVLACEREEQAKNLLSRLTGGPQAILLRADSPDEAVAFTIAAIRQIDEHESKFLEARTLIVDSDDAAREIAHRQDLIFIARCRPDVTGLLAQRGPTIVPVGRDAPARSDLFVLNRPSSHALGDAIKTMGFAEDDAHQLARKCGRSITVLARQIPRAGVATPEWADGSRVLIPALLAGAWSEDSPADQAILTALAGVRNYAEYESLLRRYVHLQDLPIDKEGAVWKLRSPLDAFMNLGHVLSRIDFENLQRAVTHVFGELDPSLELSPDDRPFAALKGKKLQHSEWLRDGLATTLLLISVMHQQAEVTTSGTTPDLFVERLIAGLPGLKEDHRLIASIQRQLPILAEAASRPLLVALEHLLEGDGARIRPIFEEGGFLSGSPHTGLLWALEILAWDPEQLPTVVLILARLAALDPGGKTANRPLNSLLEIFRAWHPNTNANLDQRLAALDYVVDRESAVGWDLLVKLLPQHLDAGHNSPKPRYREAGASARELLTNGRVAQGYVKS